MFKLEKGRLVFCIDLDTLETLYHFDLGQNIDFTPDFNGVFTDINGGTFKIKAVQDRVITVTEIKE